MKNKSTVQTQLAQYKQYVGWMEREFVRFHTFPFVLQAALYHYSEDDETFINNITQASEE